MDAAGEGAFPLRRRWEGAGRPLLDAFLAVGRGEGSSTADRSGEKAAVAPPFRRLLECVVSMLKGVVRDGEGVAEGVVITTGPSGSGRSRSYSVGGSSGTSFLDPYPEDMARAVSECLACTATETSKGAFLEGVNTSVIRLVVARPSWAEVVFPALNDCTRREIAASLLDLRLRNHELAGAALLGLPLNAYDFVSLLSNDDSLLALTFLADCIRGRSAALAGSDGSLKISSLLFNKLSALSQETASGRPESEEDGALEYAKSCLVRTLLKIHEDMESFDSAKGGEKFSSHAALLVGLIGGPNAGGGGLRLKPLVSGRSKATALALLTRLCAQAPSVVVKSLIPAMIQVISTAISQSDNSATNRESRSFEERAAVDALLAVVPAYCAHAHTSGSSFFDLLKTFCHACASDEGMPREMRFTLHLYFMNALLTVPIEGDHGDAIASFIASCMATDTNENGSAAQSANDPEIGDYSDSSSFYGQILKEAPNTEQVASFLQLLRYVGQLIDMIGINEEDRKLSTDDGETSFYRINAEDIAKIASERTEASGKRKDRAQRKKDIQQTLVDQYSLMQLITSILTLVHDGLSNPKMKKTIRNSEGSVANKCLQLWQELLQMQTASARLRSKAASLTKDTKNKTMQETLQFWEETPSSIGDCLESLQQLLPVPHFLASITSIFNEEKADGALLVRAAQLLSDRVSETDPLAAEASLYLDIVPDLVDMLPVSDEEGRSPALVQQAALMAIERLASSLCLKLRDPKLLKRRSSAFLPAMERVTALLNGLAGKVAKTMEDGKALPSETAESQILSTAALCASALIQVLKAQCLPLLSKLLKPLLTSLAITNSSLLAREGAKDERVYESAKLLQLSIVRTLLSVLDNLPQFTLPYLGQLLSPAAVPSRSLRNNELEDDIHVMKMTERLDNALAKNIPARQLIPSASKAVTDCLKLSGGGCRETQAVLGILKASIQKSARAELSPVVGKLLKALIRVFEHDGDANEKIKLLSTANETLIALVMKLSEAQLRPLYARLREWRGELTDMESKKSSVRRYAFWSFSAALSMELRSIFLPCLSSAVSDIAAELEFAVSKLCSSAKKLHGGKKRRKLEDKNETLFDIEASRPLQPLLLCLESALKADAHDGGGWIRSNDGERYNLILEPLGKLFHAKVPSDIPLASSLAMKEAASTSSFEMIVQGVGTEEHGNVAGCLTALAAAAGNEQLWKPLNHAILEACSNEERSEVRRAGVSCLLAIIQNLGEEYMVLLPECLPILSELLEDSHEDIAGLAKECITEGEELLGESLDDAIS